MVGQTILHYKITERLGQGGMGVVYKAEDTKLHRTVALKFLSPQMAADDAEKARFIQEARAAAALDHPNICTVFDVGEAAGRPYLAMAFVEGQTLAEKIKAAPLAVPEAVELAVQIGEGLREAHEKGVVHRDVKSSNIMVTPKGQAKIMDFGVAQRASGGPWGHAAEMVGTAAYMSPEQSRGETVDERTDIWSLGVVLYEMLTGRLPFQGEYEAAVLYSVQHEEPQPIAEWGVAAPPELEKILQRALSKRREDRYPHVSEMLADLRAVLEPGRTLSKSPAPALAGRRSRVLAGLGVAAVVLAGGLLLWATIRDQLPSPGTAASQTSPAVLQRPSIAVLPLKNLSGRAEQDFFAEGMTDALITNLAKIEGLRVISRTSVMQYSDARPSLPEIAATLNVAYILEGSVLRDNGQVRISAQLIDTASDRNIWAENYDRDLRDILALQSAVAMEIANEIKVQLTPTDRDRFARLQTMDPESYEHYLLGRYFSRRRTKPELEKAQEHFQAVIAKDPNSSMGFAGLADTYILMANYGLVPPTEVWPKAKAAATRAVELDDSLAEAHSSLALINSFYEWDWKNAEAEFQRALLLNPGGATEHHHYAVYLSRIGRHEEAIEKIEKARELDPLSLAINNGAGVIYYMARRYDDAIRQLNRNRDLAPNYYRTYLNLGRCYLEQSRFEVALAALNRAAELSGRNPFLVAFVAYGQARAGNSEEARRALSDLQELAKTEYVSPASLALIEIGLGERDQAFSHLQEALRERSGSLVWLKVDPSFDPLRSDPRFEQLLAEVGLSS